MDPQIQQALAAMLQAAGAVEPPAAGDTETRRQTLNGMFAQLGLLQTDTDAVQVDSFTMPVAGVSVELRWYTQTRQTPAGGVALYLHGGGMICGNLDVYDRFIKSYVAKSGVPILAVDYRLAPEHPHPAPVEDCYAALLWLKEHASELGVDAARITVMGDSAGGGLAAGVALMARDRGGPALAQQVLIYPMLDNRTTDPDAELEPFVTWTYADNITGWGALLGGGSPDAYASPAHADSLSGLPPTYLEVGELDIFRSEDVLYATRLWSAGVPTELHVHPGCPHAFDAFAPDADITQRSVADRIRRLRST